MICPRINNPKFNDFHNCECELSKIDENGNWYCDYGNMSHETFFQTIEINPKNTVMIDDIAFSETDKYLGIVYLYRNKQYVKGFDCKSLSEFIDLLISQLARMQTAEKEMGLVKKDD